MVFTTNAEFVVKLEVRMITSVLLVSYTQHVVLDSQTLSF